MKLFSYLEEVFVPCTFIFSLIPARTTFIEIEVGTRPSDFYYNVEHFETNAYYISFIVKCRSLSVANTNENLIHVR